MLSRLLRYGVTGVLMAGLICCTAFPQGNSQGHGKGKGHNKHDQGDDEGQNVKFSFGVHEREVITHYYSNRGSNLPPGLAKREEICRRGSRSNWKGTARFRRDCRSALSRVRWNSSANCHRFLRNTAAA